MVCARISRMNYGAHDIPPQASRLAPTLRALANQGVSFWDELLEVRRLGREHLCRGAAYPHLRQVLEGQGRGKLPDQIGPDLPDHLGRLCVLPVPDRSISGKAVRRNAQELRPRLQGPGTHDRRDLAETCQVWETGRACQRALPERHAPSTSSLPAGSSVTGSRCVR